MAQGAWPARTGAGLRDPSARSTRGPYRAHFLRAQVWPGLGGTDGLAGVTHGNSPSVTVMERINFAKVADFDSYSRYHLALSGEGLTAEQAAAI